MDRISRPLLARAGEQRLLSHEAIAAALELSGLRPKKSDWRQFAILAMRFSAVLSLAAGMIFLIAFNWDRLDVYARFAMVETPLVAALVVAWIKGADTQSGKLALMLAVLLTGGLLALFGQTYQTGANAYELFFGWAALAFPWVAACRYAPCWALWLLLMNVGTALHAANPANRFFLSLLLDRWHWTPWFTPFLLDVLLYVILVALSRFPDLGLAARWLRRGAVAAAMAFGTCGMIFLIVAYREATNDSGAAAAIEVVLFLAASAGFAMYAYSRRDDLFNFAMLALAWIVVTTTLLGRALLEGRAGLEALFIISLYVIGVSTAAVKAISYLGHTWKVEAPAS